MKTRSGKQTNLRKIIRFLSAQYPKVQIKMHWALNNSKKALIGKREKPLVKESDTTKRQYLYTITAVGLLTLRVPLLTPCDDQHYKTGTTDGTKTSTRR